MTLIKQSLFSVISILLLVFSVSACTDIFGFFSRETFLLSPPIQGQLLDTGKVVVGKTVYRELYYDGRHLDQTVTDQHGKFTFPASTIRTSTPSSMFGNDSLMQHIYLGKPGENEFTLWLAKLFYNGNQHSLTLKGKLSELRCDVANSAKTYDVPVQENPEHKIVIHTLCNMN
ncbi:hypothetical protein OW492_14635 [Psychromonas sp. 14N.309.X.WAT.B.A12]|jgi:hypothetical protein|uniref:DUF6795 domain-containing protein n=1 Tax=Psychromonas sp. 14N.309.X.WAT.B.A12 TaxID=2998322 RepID=UPI0025B07FFF|nr:DUF6795 domain-containing protein [Psychromonas sp. 14N.309.X.WAT.B.A12]MDN2664612.1 hypothetical protein [Psychromonas sp. 14N.309.X.WAT.B.A12]